MRPSGPTSSVPLAVPPCGPQGPVQSMGSGRPLQESWNGQWHGVTPVRPQRAGVCSVVPAHPGLLLTCRPKGASWSPVMGIEGVLALCLLNPPVQERRAGGSEVTKPPREPHDGLGATGLLGGPCPTRSHRQALLWTRPI